MFSFLFIFIKKIAARVRFVPALCLALGAGLGANAQCPGETLQFHADIPSVPSQNVMTIRKDRQGRPFLYVASKEGGLKIYDLADLSAPVAVTVIPVQNWGNLHVMNLEQYGNYLYLALGNHFSGVLQSPGLAIVDVADPEMPVVADFWASPDFDHGGAGIVKVEGNYAYLGAMEHGLIILNVADKNQITHVKNFKPDLDFPHGAPPPGDTAKYNARGMEIRNDTLWLCYDRGGLRVLDVQDKEDPVELSRYCNTNLTGYATAYNNLILDGNRIYAAIDYCGVEVLDVSDPADIRQMGWWHPWTCPTNNLFVWAGSPGHANELAYDKDCRVLFVATGKSDLHLVSVADPENPDSCGFYGGTGNQIGTWGVDLKDHQLFLSYIFTAIPFSSNWTGVRVLSYDACIPNAVANPDNTPEIEVFPNPAANTVYLKMNRELRVYGVYLTDINGRKVKIFDPGATELPLGGLPSGVYGLQVVTEKGVANRKLLVDGGR